MWIATPGLYYKHVDTEWMGVVAMKLESVTSDEIRWELLRADGASDACRTAHVSLFQFEWR